MRILLLIILLALTNIGAFYMAYRSSSQDIRSKAVGLRNPVDIFPISNQVDSGQDVLGNNQNKDSTPAAKKTSPSPKSPLPGSPSPSPAPISPPPGSVVPSPSAASATRWAIQSVSSMKETKDRICFPRDKTFIRQWVGKAKELGANYISIETPYDNPVCGSALAYTKTWVEEIRAAGLKVWHRHMPLAFEGIYNVGKIVNIDYLPLITNYIKTNPAFFVEGDIFTPIPEPQNGGITGINYCSSSLCYFKSREDFNSWLRRAISVSSDAFSSIGLGGKIKIGYFGFDGYIVWGDNNPDWSGILEDATVTAMGNLTIDHYPEAVGDTMANDLAELTAKYPNVPIVIGEWGTVGGGDIETRVKNSMGAAAKVSQVVGFNYWHLGMGGNEALIRDDFSNRVQFDEVQSFFKP